METLEREKKTSRFIILIPHRDSGKLLDNYRAGLFTAGFPGAFSFPAAAPLALVSKPFSREELKCLAGNIRSLTGKTGGKITIGETGLVHCPGLPGSFFGPLLNLSADNGVLREILLRTAGDKILHSLFPTVLCAALIASLPSPAAGENPAREEAPVLPMGHLQASGLCGGFRGASLANLTIRPLGAGDPDYSFEWKIGTPVWLPKYSAKL